MNLHLRVGLPTRGWGDRSGYRHPFGKIAHVTFSHESDQSKPNYDQPTIRIAPVAPIIPAVPAAGPGTVPPAQRQQAQPVARKSKLRRIARRIVGPTILTKK